MSGASTDAARAAPTRAVGRSPNRGRSLATVIGLVVGLAVSAVCCAAAAAAPRLLTFDEAVRLALTTNPKIKQSKERVRAAHGALAAARGERWPRLNLEVSGTRSDNPLNALGFRLNQRSATFNDFGAGQFTGPDALDVAPQNLNYPGARSNVDTRLQLQWPLYMGGGLAAAADRARSLAQAARHNDLAARQALIYAVLAAYEGVRAAQSQVGVATGSQVAARAYLKTAAQRYRHGAAIKSDVLTARVNLVQAGLELLRTRNTLATARARFRAVVGLGTGAAFRLGPAVMPKLPQATLMELEARALSTNPGLAALQSRVRARRADIAAGRAAYRPHFSVVLQNDWYDDTLGLGASSYTLSGVLSWELFDFGARRGTLDQAQASAAAARWGLEDARSELRLKVADTWRAVQEAAAAVRVNTASVAQAREAQRILRLRFAQGLSTITDVLAGQTRLDGARAGVVAAQYRERLARARLLLVLGTLDLPQLTRAGQRR